MCQDRNNDLTHRLNCNSTGWQGSGCRPVRPAILDGSSPPAAAADSVAAVVFAAEQIGDNIAKFQVVLDTVNFKQLGTIADAAKSVMAQAEAFMSPINILAPIFGAIKDAFEIFT